MVETREIVNKSSLPGARPNLRAALQATRTPQIHKGKVRKCERWKQFN
jgi:hypothetical protein